MKEKKTILLIRRWLLVLMIVLFMSGVTAIPVEAELSVLLKIFATQGSFHNWLERVLSAFKYINHDTPFVLYGYDWLAFAHFILAILFIGPYRDPVKNVWVIQFGLIACALIFPLAFFAGYFRGIPIGWRLIDCSFGALGFLPLWISLSKTKALISKNYST